MTVCLSVRRPGFGDRSDLSAPVGLLLALFMLIATCLWLPSPARAEIKVAAAGDVACTEKRTALHEGDLLTRRPHQMKCQGKAVGDLIAAEQPEFTLALGDIFQGPSAPRSEYDNFDRAWAVLGDDIMPTVGNHDTYKPSSGPRNFDGYFDYWEDRDAPKWKIGTRNRSWTSWDTGSWHMINLTSTCNVVDCSLTSRQLRWLLRDLKRDRQNSRTKCTLAYFHHPLFSSGTQHGRAGDRMLVSNLWELLYRYRADLVVTGHQHFYERYRPQNPSGKRDPTGITQFISGTGGHSSHPIKVAPRSTADNAVASFRSPGATILELNESGFKWSFHGVTGKVFDQARREVKCHPRNAGYKRRRPRARRYQIRMKRLRSLKHRAARLTRQNSRLRRIAAPAKPENGAAKRAEKRSSAANRAEKRIRAAKRAQKRITERIRRLDQRRLRLEGKPLY